jgi:hypothetical protein
MKQIAAITGTAAGFAVSSMSCTAYGSEYLTVGTADLQKGVGDGVAGGKASFGPEVLLGWSQGLVTAMFAVFVIMEITTMLLGAFAVSSGSEALKNFLSKIPFFGDTIEDASGSDPLDFMKEHLLKTFKVALAVAIGYGAIMIMIRLGLYAANGMLGA